MGDPSETREITIDRVVAFEEWSTATLSDAMDELGVRSVLHGIHAQRIGQARVAGYALPVHFIRKHHDKDAYRFGGGVGRPLEMVLKTMSRGQLVVMDLDGALDASAWGGLASRLALLKGVRGTILNGTCRDVEEIRALGYPVWATGTCPRRSRNEFSFGSIGEPIEVGGTVVGAGDIVVADGSGVVCIPRSRANEVYELAKKIAASEQRMLGEIAVGTGVDWENV